MFINWDVTTRFDPNSLEPSTHGIPIPSYGNYGGPNYSAGVEGGTTPETPTNPAPVDALDFLFWQHDLVYQHFKDGTATPTDIAQADVHLIEGMYGLTQTDFFANNPEALLYEGLATLTIGSKILTTPEEFAYFQTLPGPEKAVVVEALHEAVPNFEIGLAETPGNESRSLHGAFHVFEAHFAENIAPAVAGAAGTLNDAVNTHSSPNVRDYTYTTIDDPLATNNNFAEGINSANKIVGYYSDGSLFHGFLYSGGTYTTLDFSSNVQNFSSNVQTFAEGINASGQIVGWYNDLTRNHGFLYNDGVYTTIDDPLGTVNTFALGINASGDIVGYYQTPTSRGGLVDHGFIYSDGVYTTLEDPLQGTDPSVQSPIGTTAFGINASGQIVGYFYDGTGLAHGYLYDHGTYTTLDDPLGTLGTFPLDINNAGQIVGWYFDNLHQQHAFLYSGGNYTTLDAFGITINNSTATGINNAGNIVGNYSDLTSPFYTHGFVATATPGAAGKFVSTDAQVSQNVPPGGMSPVTNSSINSNGPQQETLAPEFGQNTTGHVLANDPGSLSVTNVNGLAADVGHAVTGAASGHAADTFVFAPNFGENTITNFNFHKDTLELPKSEFADLAAVLADAHQNGADTIIAHDAHDIITLHNVSLSQLHDSHILLV